MKMVITAKELAEIIKYEASTVKWMASAHPEKLPPRFKHGTKKLLWALADVERWVALNPLYANWQKMPEVITAKELAEIIGYEMSTVRWMASAHPEKLPPRIKDRTRRLMWALADVEKWVASRSHYATSQKVPERSGCSTPSTNEGHGDQEPQQVLEHLTA